MARAVKPVSMYQHKILDWLRDNHPDGWVRIGGVQLQASRGLECRGLVEIVGRPGKYRIRLTDEGRS